MKRILLIGLISLVSIYGCEKQAGVTPPAKVETVKATAEPQLPALKLLFGEPINAHRFELPSEALQVWRQTKSAKPALVLFSIHPLLEPLAEEQTADVLELIRSGDTDTFKQRGSFYRVNPALLPTQTLSAAIADDLFSEIIWVVPTQFEVEKLSLDILRKQLVDAGFLTVGEGEALSLSEGVTSGTVRGLRFRAVHPDALPDLDRPAVVHFDTGYFNGMFKNEVATPPYDILHQTVSRVMQVGWNVYSATLSYSTMEFNFSLDVRFLITNLAKMIEDPALLQQMPPAWTLHGDAMYISTMYLETKSQEAIEAALIEAPEDPVIVYALSQVRFKQGHAAEAFKLLDKAVKLDPGYGVAYLQLADIGQKNKQFDKALELQKKGERLYPENPFIQISTSELLLQMNRPDEAIKSINDLKKLPWSTFFHADVLENLSAMEEFARNPQPTEIEPAKTSD